jgi:hypothetical protein
VAAEIEISTVADASVLSGIGWLAPLPVHAASNLDPEKELRPWQPLITAPFSRSRRPISGKSYVISTITRFGSTAATGAGSEDGKSGDAVGAIRSVLVEGRHIRQRLLALSDTDRSQSSEFCGAPPCP